MTIGDRIKELRENNGMSQVELADILDVSKQTLYKYENNIITNIPSDKIEKIANIFKISPAYIMGWTDNVSLLPQSQTIFVDIDILGSVPAGVPVEAFEDIIGQVQIPADWTKGGQIYKALKVHGDSMYPFFLDGDTVILKITPECDSGKNAVIFVNGYEATLKKFIKNSDGTVTLKALNPEYQSKTYNPKETEIRIFGVVVQLIRGEI